MMTVANNAYDDNSNNRDSKKDNGWQFNFDNYGPSKVAD